ncbi:MAG: glycosyltransferase [Bacillota bacterium]
MVEASDKVTIIVPVFNTSAYLNRCLDSICQQTYSNLEVIVVDDCSTDDSRNIAESYAERDSRVSLLLHSKNKGLFAARVTGIKQSTGKYIAFVDSDDYISIDFIRCLVSCANKTGADVVVAKIVHEAEGVGRYVHSMYHNYDFGDVKDGEVFDKYMAQEGQCFIWHTVWNKLYRRKLWEQALPYISTIDRHIIMTEDFLFSTIIMNLVKRIASCEYAYYFYFQHNNASTSLHGKVDKYYKNIDDLIYVFSAVEHYLLSVNASAENIAHFAKWRALYCRFWVDNVYNSIISAKDKDILISKLRTGMGGKIQRTTPTDHHFYSITMAWDGRYNELITLLATSGYKYYSFDIFDTLVTRPYHEPKDMFSLMNEEFYKISGRNDDFGTNRAFAEHIARVRNITVQDITMQDIYLELQKIYGYSDDIVKALTRYEEALEIESCNARRSVKNIYELLLFLDKKIICVSDMYLSGDVVKRILQHNGYNRIAKLYLSGEIGLSKSGRKLFPYVVKDLKIGTEELFHIGDNWDSDKVAAGEAGIDAWFYPSCKDVFFNSISDISYSDTANKYEKPTSSWLNLEAGLKYFGTRSALAVAYNRMCDNPYMSYKEGSNFNASPQFMGGYPLGMHILGVAKFIREKGEKYNKIHFIARDGYLPMLAYKALYGGEQSYLHISRKSLFPLTVVDKKSFMQLGEYADWRNSSPRKIISLILPTLSVDRVEDVVLPKKIILDKPFNSYDEYVMVIESIVDGYFSAENLASYKKDLAEYFASLIGKNEVAFDIGYSGRAEVILSQLLGYNIDAIYIHRNATKFKDDIARMGINIESFYDFTPSITGGVREVTMSSCEPSTVGYNCKAGEVIFEDSEMSYPARYTIGEMHRAALTYIEDIKNTLLSIDGVSLERLDWRNIDISAPFEMLMHHATVSDRGVFDVFIFEDELYDGRSDIKLSEIWSRDINYHYSGIKFSNHYFSEKYSVHTASMWKKLIFYWLFDKDRLKTKLNERLGAKGRA